MRTVAAVVAVLMGAVAATAAFGFAKPKLAMTEPEPVTIRASPIASFAKFEKASASNTKLVWRGGLVLSADTGNFGGYSGLILSADGRDLLAVSDAGGWLQARVTYDGDRPTALTNAVIGAILARDGKPIRSGRERDAEELALASGTLAKGDVLISYERVNRIVRYTVSRAGLGRPLEIIAAPPGLNRFSNDGLEAMTVLKGGTYAGRMIAFSENAGSDGRHPGWLWTSSGPKPLQVVSHGGFALTAAASLADGTLLLLERRFTFLDGVGMRLRRIDPSAIKPGAVLDGEVLLEADLSDEIDNMEGLAVHTGPAGETVLTVISDDNFNRALQRTLLLQFTLLPAPPQS